MILPLIPERIVAEVTSNWAFAVKTDDKPLLSKQFEHVIRVNATRGYALESWKLHQLVDAEKRSMSETIVAVFVKV